MKKIVEMLKNTDAVSEVVGAVLLLGIAVLFLAVLQATAIPIWDSELEQDHISVVYNDFIQLRSNTLHDNLRSAPIEIGFLYPNRILLLNPTKGISGTIFTQNQTVRIEGLVGGGVEYAENDSVVKRLSTDWLEYDLHANKSTVPGAKLIYSFNGTNLSIDFWKTDDSGFASVSVDGTIYKQINLYIPYSQYTGSNGTLETYPIVAGLDFGTHIVEVEVIGTHSEGSTGNFVIVDSFRPGIIYVNSSYTTSKISYAANNNFASTPEIVLEHGLVLNAYDGYTFTKTSPQITSNTFFLPLIHTPETSISSIESTSIDTNPAETIEYTLIDANITFDSDYPRLWNQSIIPSLANSGITARVNGNTVTIRYNTSARLLMPVIDATIGGEVTGTGVTEADTTPPDIWFSSSLPIALNLTNNTQPLIIANYSDASGINVSSMKVYIDGNLETANITLDADHVECLPILTPGWHNVTIEVSDTIGNTGSLTSNDFFVVVEPWVDILAPTAASPANVQRGFNTTVNFTYTDTNARSYIIKVNNSMSIIGYVEANVTVTSGINVLISQSIYINASAVLGDYDVWVRMNDSTGYSNFTLEADAVNVTRPQADYFEITNTGVLSSNKKKIINFIATNNGTTGEVVTVDKITVSWITDSGELIQQVEFFTPNVDFWNPPGVGTPTVDSSSGTELNGTDQNITDGTSREMQYSFNNQINDKTFTILFTFTDGSSRSITFTT